MSARDLAATATAQEARAVAHRAVTEGVNLRYVEQLRRATYALADMYDEQAARIAALEKQAADAQADPVIGHPTVQEALRVMGERVNAAEERAVRAEEALQQIAAHRGHTSDPIDCLNACIETADIALAAAGADTP